ncbi:unnamed protein product [Effrenium voratum]|uniref:Uncharacterized protein n=1 Tax=Effrenium voratum TaxID=2562239 RepID=A0AA36J0G9_9DINO|nr:unnamed protein product [Effrenium voratum]
MVELDEAVPYLGKLEISPLQLCWVFSGPNLRRAELGGPATSCVSSRTSYRAPAKQGLYTEADYEDGLREVLQRTEAFKDNRIQLARLRVAWARARQDLSKDCMMCIIIVLVKGTTWEPLQGVLDKTVCKKYSERSREPVWVLLLVVVSYAYLIPGLVEVLFSFNIVFDTGPGGYYGIGPEGGFNNSPGPYRVVCPEGS